MKHRLAGFTLLEVLLAMTLMSLMMVLLFASLRTGAESWSRGERKIAQINEKAVVYQFFKRHLLSTRPLWIEQPDEPRRFAMQGERESLQFVSVFPASAGRKGLQLFRVAFKTQGNDAGAITVTLRPFYQAEDEGEMHEQQETLIENVHSFSVGYFDGEERNWSENWLDKDSLPALIKVSIKLTDDSDWPEMVFPLKLAGAQSVQAVDLGL